MDDLRAHLDFFGELGVDGIRAEPSWRARRREKPAESVAPREVVGQGPVEEPQGAQEVRIYASAADALIGTAVDEAALERLAAAASAACRPIDDKRGTKEFRIKVAGVLARRAAAIALDRARQN